MRTPRTIARGVPMGLMTVRCLISKALHLPSLYKVKIVMSVAMAIFRNFFQLFLRMHYRLLCCYCNRRKCFPFVFRRPSSSMRPSSLESALLLTQRKAASASLLKGMSNSISLRFFCS